MLYLIGKVIKKSKLNNKYIPIILGIIGTTMAIVWVIATSNISSIQEAAAAIFTAVTQGILTAGASVYTNQICVQAKKASDIT